MRHLRDPAWQGAGVLLTMIVAFFSFGGWVYQSGHHRWGLVVLILGSLTAAVVISCTAILAIRLVWRRVPFRIVRVSEETPSADELSASHSPALTFDPYAIRARIDQVDLSGLDRPESVMVFTLRVRNMTGYQVRLTGVEGRIRWNSEECSFPVTMQKAPLMLPMSGFNECYCILQQVVLDSATAAISYELNGPVGKLSFDLSGLRFVGEAELPTGRVALEGCYLFEVNFLVKGPAVPQGQPWKLVRFSTIFGREDQYNDDGSPKS